MNEADALDIVQYAIWTVLLAIIAFSLSLLGTFLVRSGVLTSVHAFAVDPQRGLMLLAILALWYNAGSSDIGAVMQLNLPRSTQIKEAR